MNHTYGRKQRGTKQPLDEGERGEWKAGLKVNIQKMKIMAFGPNTSWQIDGETMETVTNFIFLGSRITTDGDWNLEIKRCLLLGRKGMASLGSILKSRNTILPIQVHLVKAMVFPVVMYGCESWTIKKAEHWRTDAFELWCWRGLLRVPWTVVLPWIFTGRTDAEAEAQILWPLDRNSWLIGKDLDAGKDREQEEKGVTEDEMVGWYHQLSGHECEQTPGDSAGKGSLAFCSPWGCKESDVIEWLNNNLESPKIVFNLKIVLLKPVP